MLQQSLLYYDRRFLDDTPTQSMAACVAVVEEKYATFRCTDGQNTATIDFFYSTEEEREQCLKKLDSIQQLVDEFAFAIRAQIAKQKAMAEDEMVAATD